jgi:hypothetical protein
MKENKGKKKYTHASCVKFDDKEYTQIKKASKVTGRSIPDILRSSYFLKPIGRPLVENSMAKKIVSELNRIGNNVNQIARQVNNGIYEGWHSEFKEFYQHYVKVCQLLSSYSSK